MSSNKTPISRELDKNAAQFLKAPEISKLFEAFEKAGFELRVNGGAVRNALMGEPIDDIDLSSDALPHQVQALTTKAGFKAVPTGLEHGTITVVVDGKSFEVTTLREDIETDGRHAVVKFGTDWHADAMRRDLTINAIYADKDGMLHDYVGGFDDIHTRNVRFIGDAHERIEEDALRILRFFRFFAWYGPKGAGRPDADGLRASAKAKEQLEHLSVERVWKELRKLLAAKNPARSLLWMRTTGVLNIILPESEKWGIDAIGPLMEMEERFNWDIDPLLRLGSITPLNELSVKKMAKRLKLSKSDEKQLLQMAANGLPHKNADDDALNAHFYYHDLEALQRRLKLAVALAQGRAADDEIDLYSAILAKCSDYTKPVFPVSGADLIEKGVEAGPQMGEALKRMEDAWVDSDFQLTKAQLLEAP